jgi:hypothetical protein
MQQARSRNNARSLFQVEQIPSDNHIRQTLDPMAPHHLFGLFDELHRALDQTGLLEQMRAVERTRLIALDAKWYFSSQNMGCANGSRIQHTSGEGIHFQSAITPVIVSPSDSDKHSILYETASRFSATNAPRVAAKLGYFKV